MTISATTVSSTTYYVGLGETSSRDCSAVGSQAYVSYYERDVLELPGRWRVVSVKDRHRGDDDPFHAIRNGAFIDRAVFDKLAEGRHPKTGQPLIKSAPGRRVQAIDLQIPMCKSASLLAMLGPPDVQKAIASAKQKADERLLKYIVKKGLLVARKGAAGKRKIAITDIVAIQFGHLLSRELDPHLHDHWLIVNLAQTADGEFVTFDTIRLKKHLGALSALHRAWFASALKREIGCAFRRSGRNIEIDGVSDDVVALFSKRRKQIEEESLRHGFDTAIDRVKAQRAAHNTRKRKRLDLSFPDLVIGWQDELQTLDQTPASLWQSVERAAAAARSHSHADDVRSRDIDAIPAIFQTDSILSEIEVLRRFAEARQCERSGDEIIAVLDAFKMEGRLVALDGGTAFTTPAMVELEHRMLRDAMGLRGTWAVHADWRAAQSFDTNTTLSEEQRAAVDHALGPDGVVVVEGRAGVGKSFMLGEIQERTRRADLNFQVVAPSWKAVEVARYDAGILRDDANAIQGFVNKLRKGERALGARDVVVVDEAGMVDLNDMATLVEHAKAVGAKIILTGDTRQLAPVSAGAPMASLSQCLGSSSIERIRRQSDADERTASMHFANGDIQRAMDIYGRRGAVETHLSNDAAIDAVVKRSIGFHREKHQPAVGEHVPSQLVLASTRADVHALNAAIRAALVAEGFVGWHGFTTQAIPRNEKKPVDLTLAVGDEVIFGEKVVHASGTIYNGDVATVLAIEERARHLHLQLKLAGKAADNGDLVVAGALSDFVGFRSKEQPAIPILQHAYARTVHGSQGATVDHVTVFNSRPLSKEALYVAMTRHRVSVRMIVDGSRVAESLALHDRYIDPGGLLKVRERHLSIDPAIFRTNVLARIVKDAARVKTAANLSAFVPDVNGWLNARDPTAELRRQLAPKAPQEAAMDFVAQRRRRPQPIPSIVRSPLRFNFAERDALGRRDTEALLSKLFPSILKAPSAHRGYVSYLLAEAGRHLKLHIKAGAQFSSWFTDGAIVRGSFDKPLGGVARLATVVWNTSMRSALKRLRSILALDGLNPLAEAAERRYEAMEQTPREPRPEGATRHGIDKIGIAVPPNCVSAGATERDAGAIDRAAGRGDLEAKPTKAPQSSPSTIATTHVDKDPAAPQLSPLDRLTHKKKRQRRESNALAALHRRKRADLARPTIHRPRPIIER